MQIPRFFINPEAIDTGKGFVLVSDKAIVSQITKVLRLGVDDQVDVLDGCGNIFRCELCDLPKRNGGTKSSIVARIKEKRLALGDASVAITVGLSLLKNDRFEWAIEKMTELGVAKIVPLMLSRSIVKNSGRSERWQSIAKEAAEQCERATIPHIVSPRSFAEFLGDPKFKSEYTYSFICAERSDAPSLKNVLCNWQSNPIHSQKHRESISIFVGAEGGFTQEELDLARHHGVSLVSLGPRILRAETAAIYAVGLIVSFLDV
jgi:16S rRNA (uracil1498-N3)-methyltransferase